MMFYIEKHGSMQTNRWNQEWGGDITHILSCLRFQFYFQSESNKTLDYLEQ